MIKQPTRKTDFTPKSISKNRMPNGVELSGRKSKLETYIEVLEELAHSRQAHIVDVVASKSEDYAKVLDFLAEQGLIRKRDLGRNIAYSTTRRGLSVLKYFSLIKTMPKMSYNSSE